MTGWVIKDMYVCTVLYTCTGGLKSSDLSGEKGGGTKYIRFKLSFYSESIYVLYTSCIRPGTRDFILLFFLVINFFYLFMVL